MSEQALLTILSLAPFILAAVLVIYWLPRLIMARRWNQHKAKTVRQWESDGVEFVRGPVGGQFGGLESMGAKRVVRGIGFAALTDKELRVTRAAPSAEWWVPFKQIKGVTLQPDFLGQTSHKVPFIVVRFVKDGQADKLGFKVNDYQAWAKDLAKAAHVSLKSHWNK